MSEHVAALLVLVILLAVVMACYVVALQRVGTPGNWAQRLGRRRAK